MVGKLTNTASVVAVTKPDVQVNGHDISAEDFIVWCARVSNPKSQEQGEGNNRLLNYLIKHKHWSPFEMVSVTIDIHTTRDIGRQILRHRSFHFQEFSQRYSEVDGNDFHIRDVRLQDTKNRQNSIEPDPMDAADLYDKWYWMQDHTIQVAIQNYKDALELGIAKEQARCLLPEGLTPTRMLMTGTVRDWFHYCNLRTGNGTQKEHQEIAKNCVLVLSDYFPNIF